MIRNKFKTLVHNFFNNEVEESSYVDKQIQNNTNTNLTLINEQELVKLFKKNNIDNKDNERLERLLRMYNNSDFKVNIKCDKVIGHHIIIKLDNIDVAVTPNIICNINNYKIYYNRFNEKDDYKSLSYSLMEDSKFNPNIILLFTDIYMKGNDMRFKVN